MFSTSPAPDQRTNNTHPTRKTRDKQSWEVGYTKTDPGRMRLRTLECACDLKFYLMPPPESNIAKSLKHDQATGQPGFTACCAALACIRGLRCACPRKTGHERTPLPARHCVVAWSTLMQLPRLQDSWGMTSSRDAKGGRLERRKHTGHQEGPQVRPYYQAILTKNIEIV